MTNHERAGHLVSAQIAIVKMVCRDVPETQMRDLFMVIVEATLDAVSSHNESARAQTTSAG